MVHLCQDSDPAMFSLEKFAWILAPQHFDVETDNLGVKNLLMAKMGSNVVLGRWFAPLGEFDFTVIYCPDGDLILANWLSTHISEGH